MLNALPFWKGKIIQISMQKIAKALQMK